VKEEKGTEMRGEESKIAQFVWRQWFKECRSEE
jgi:hypothetical protein